MGASPPPGALPPAGAAPLPKKGGGVSLFPGGVLLLFRLASGYGEGHPINNWRTAREPVESFATFRGF